MRSLARTLKGLLVSAAYISLGVLFGVLMSAAISAAFGAEPQADSPRQGGIYRGDIYSETLYQGEYRNVVSTVRLRQSLHDGWLTFRPYIGVFSQFDSKSKQGLIYNENFAVISAGLLSETLLPHTSVFGQVAFRHTHLSGTAKKNGAEVRLGTAYYNEWRLAPETSRGPGIEGYADAVFLRHDESNLFLSAFARPMLTLPLGSLAFADLYAEPRILLDTQGYDYNNKLEGTLGLRGRMRISSFYVQLFGGRTHGRYLKSPSAFESNYSEWRSLLVIGGAWNLFGNGL